MNGRERSPLRRSVPLRLVSIGRGLPAGLRPFEQLPDGLTDARREGREQHDGHEEGDEAQLRSGSAEHDPLSIRLRVDTPLTNAESSPPLQEGAPLPYA